MIEPQMLIALAFLVVAAVSAISVASFRFRDNLRKSQFSEAIQAGDALSMPIVGSVALFSIYVLLRFIPKEYFNVLISFYLSVVSIFALGSFLERYIKPNVFTGLCCIATAAAYFWTKNWILNDILACAVCVTTLEMVPINNFATTFILLIGLFFYDIFWVFGSDVMLTVATGVDGPIKLVFPQTLFGDHSRKSLLGLGDLIVPGFFIAQTLAFSRDVVKRGNFYFIVAITAYFCSLVNTMVVMVVFKHGQPALLFIVPWLLISFTAAAVYKGDVIAAWNYDALESVAPTADGSAEATTAKETAAGKEEPASRESEEDSFLGAIGSAFLHLMGLDRDSAAPTPAETTAAEKKNA